MIPAGFHFLRPEWLLALIPAVVLALLAWRRLGAGRDDWAGLVDAHLLRHLAVRDRGSGRRWPILALLLAWALSAVALAGPAWQKVPTPTLDRLDPVVVVLSLSATMDGADRAPSRLVAARHKIEDLLGRMRGGQVGLVIFAEAPFVASPLTEDARVVGAMLPELATDLMPVPGDRPDLGIAEASQLLRNTGVGSGRIVLVTDGPGQDPAATRAAVAEAAAEGYAVSVLDVAAGSDAEGTRRVLSDLASLGHGRFAALSPDGRDLDVLLAKSVVSSTNAPLQESGLTADQWVDMGSWLLVLVAPLAALAFRRGWLAAVPLAFLLGTGFPGAPAHAQAPAASGTQAGSLWRNLWQTPDQQGAGAFTRKDYDTAARTFADPAWKGSALYEGGKYDAAVDAFGSVEGADYNRGNALARAGRLEEAVSAYEAALARDPQDEDAAYNLDLVKRILDQRKQPDEPQPDEPQQDQTNSGDGDGGGGQQPQPDQASPDGKDEKEPQQSEGPEQAQQPEQKQGASQPDQKPAPEQAQQETDPATPEPDKQGQDEPPLQPGQDQNAGNTSDASASPPPPDPKPEQPSSEPANPPPPEQGQQPPPQAPPVAAMPRPMTEQDQNREQALRSVPDDPVGLLRARIRSHYSGEPVPAFEDQP